MDASPDRPVMPANGTGDAIIPHRFRVTRKRSETADTLTFDLAPADGLDGFAFTPGQFNMLYLFGLGEVPISISGDAEKPDKLIHTVRLVGSVTNGFADLKRGDTIGVRGPYGAGWPMSASAGGDVLVIAGGLGLAPLRPAIYHLLAHRDQFRRVTILYGARSPADLLYRQEVPRWRQRLDVNVEVTVDRADLRWLGNVGVITTLVARAEFDPDHTTALVCGPGVMMRFVAAALERRGLAADRIHVSLERNMRCAIAHCGHCQLGPHFICKDGPVLAYDRVRDILQTSQV